MSNLCGMLSNIKYFTISMNKTSKSHSLNSHNRVSSNASQQNHKAHPNLHPQSHLQKFKIIKPTNIGHNKQQKQPYPASKAEEKQREQDKQSLGKRERAQSVFSHNHKVTPMEQSYVTVRNAQKQRFNKFKIQKQLRDYEEINAKKAGEMRQRKKEEKNKVAINLIKITKNDDQDYKSVKIKHKSPLKNEDLMQIKSRDEPTLKMKENIVVIQKQVKVEHQIKKQITISPILQIKITPQKQLLLPKQESKLNESIAHHRLTNSFFYKLHTKIDQIDLHKEQEVQQYSYKYSPAPKQSQTLINTKNLLRELNEQLREAGLVDPQQESMQVKAVPSHIQEKINEVFINESLYESQSRRTTQIQAPIIINNVERFPRLNLRSSLIDYQIVVQNVPKPQSNKGQQQLHKEINLLKQLVNDLKIESQKMHAQSERNYSKQVTISNSMFHNTQQSSSPFILNDKDLNNRAVKSSLGNFSQSIVAQFNPKHFRTSSTNISGKIVKNFSPHKHRVEVKEKLMKKQEQIRQQVNQTDIKDNSLNNERKQIVPQPLQVKNTIQRINNVSISAKNVTNYNNVRQQIISNSSNLIPVMTQSINCLSQIHSVPQEILLQRTKQAQQIYNEHNQQIVKKKLIDRFDDMQRKSSYKSKVNRQIESKLRLSKQDQLKEVKAKAEFNPSINKVVIKKQSNKIQNQSRRSFSNPYKSDIRQSKSSKNFRVRQQPEMMKSLRINSSKQFKSNIMMKQENAVYVPPRSELFTHNQLSSPKEEEKLYSVHFAQKEVINKFVVAKRNITFKHTQIPIFPEAPNHNTPIQQIVKSIKQINNTLNLHIDEDKIANLILKKYKNSMVIDLASEPKTKIIWYYTGKIYIGDWNESSMIKSGQGVQYIPQKYLYRGQFVNDKKNGSGSLIKANGYLYEGQWFEGEKNGKGKCYDPSIKLSYLGQWKVGKKHGYGYFSVENQSIYEGSFADNNKQGFGTEQFYSGDSYKGQYLKGIFHGKGKYVWSSGDYYEGQFFQGCKHGKGKLIFKAGEVYAGQYRRDKKQGKGRYMWQNGCIYEGQFLNDLKHGKGHLLYPDGREIKGLWKEDKLVQFQLQFSTVEREISASKKSQVDNFTIVNVDQAKPKQFRSPGKLSKL